MPWALIVQPFGSRTLPEAFNPGSLASGLSLSRVSWAKAPGRFAANAMSKAIEVVRRDLDILYGKDARVELDANEASLYPGSTLETPVRLFRLR